MSSKSLLQRRVDVVLEDSSQIDRILFEIVEQADGVEEGSIICLCAQSDRLIVGVDVALPDMAEDVVGFDRISWNKHLEEGVVNCVQGQANNQ